MITCKLYKIHILQALVKRVISRGLVPFVGKEKTNLVPMQLMLITKSYQKNLFQRVLKKNHFQKVNTKTVANIS